MAVPKPLLTEFGIHHRLESCAQLRLPAGEVGAMCSYLVRKVDDPELLTEVRAPTQGQQHDEGPSADQTVEQRSVLTHRLHEGVASERWIRWVWSLLTHLHSSKLLIILRGFRKSSAKVHDHVEHV